MLQSRDSPRTAPGEGDEAGEVKAEQQAKGRGGPRPGQEMSSRDPTSLAPHERLTDQAVVPREKPHQFTIVLCLLALTHLTFSLSYFVFLFTKKMVQFSPIPKSQLKLPTFHSNSCRLACASTNNSWKVQSLVPTSILPPSPCGWLAPGPPDTLMALIFQDVQTTWLCGRFHCPRI